MTESRDTTQVRVNEWVSPGIGRIDRPRGTAHPRFPEFIYPLDYGYLEGPQGGDGNAVDVWRGALAADYPAYVQDALV